MTNSTNAIATIDSKIEATVTINGKSKKETFTVQSATEHCSSIFDKLYLLQEEQLPLFREIGNILIQIRLCNNNNKQFKELIGKTALAEFSQPDLWQCRFIAESWKQVSSLNKSGRLNSLGVSSIRKIVLEAYPELSKTKKTSSAGNTSKGKKKADKSASAAGNSQERIEEVVANTVFQTVVAQSETELAEQAFDQIKEGNFSGRKVLEALKELIVADLTDLAA